MNVLPFDRQVAVVAALTEGCSIRAIERLTGIHRDTIMRLGRDVGVGCAKLHNALMRELHVGRVELDETWSYVGKKRDHVKPGDPAEFGDQYVFVALDSTSKGIISYRVGKRDGENTRRFVDDLKSRLDNNPEISSDGFRPIRTRSKARSAGRSTTAPSRRTTP